MATKWRQNEVKWRQIKKMATTCRIKWRQNALSKNEWRQAVSLTNTTSQRFLSRCRIQPPILPPPPKSKNSKNRVFFQQNQSTFTQQ